MSAVKQRDKAIKILESNLAHLSILYKACFRAMGRGAMLVYASDVIEGRLPTDFNYRTQKEILFIFDNPSSKATLKEMVEKYDYKKEGIMTLITSYSNATFFVTFKFK